MSDLPEAKRAELTDMMLQIPAMGDERFEMHVTISVVQDDRRRVWFTTTSGRLAEGEYWLRIPETRL